MCAHIHTVCCCPPKMTPEEHQLRIIHAGAMIMILIITAYHAAALAIASHPKKCAQHTSSLSGEQWVQELLSGHEDRIFNELGMRKTVFQKLLEDLRANAGVHDTRYVSAEEQLSTFLHYVHRGLSNRALQERFQRSGGTISKCVSMPSYVVTTNVHLDPYIRSSALLSPLRSIRNMYSFPRTTSLFQSLSWAHGARGSLFHILMNV
jgi:hypothetical protein